MVSKKIIIFLSLLGLVACRENSVDYATLAREKCSCYQPWIEYQLQVKQALQKIDTFALDSLASKSDQVESASENCREILNRKTADLSENQLEKLEDIFRRTCPEIAKRIE